MKILKINTIKYILRCSKLVIKNYQLTSKNNYNKIILKYAIQLNIKCLKFLHKNIFVINAKKNIK